MTRPFLMGTHDAPQAGPSPLPAGAAQRASRADSAKKRATTSVFKPAQQCGTLSPACLLLPASSGILGSGPAIVTLKHASMRKGVKERMTPQCVCLSSSTHQGAQALESRLFT